MNVVVNSNASGLWSQRVGMEVEYVGLGANPYHSDCHWRGKPVTLPTRWLDFPRPVLARRPLLTKGGML